MQRKAWQEAGSPNKPTCKFQATQKRRAGGNSLIFLHWSGSHFQKLDKWRLTTRGWYSMVRRRPSPPPHKPSSSLSPPPAIPLMAAWYSSESDTTLYILHIHTTTDYSSARNWQNKFHMNSTICQLFKNRVIAIECWYRCLIIITTISTCMCIEKLLVSQP